MQDDLLTAGEIGEVATIFEVSPFGCWVRLVKVFFDTLCDHTLIIDLRGGREREREGRGGEGDEDVEVVVAHNSDRDDDVHTPTSIIVIIIFRSFDTSTLLPVQFMVILEAIWDWSSLSNCMYVCVCVHARARVCVCVRVCVHVRGLCAVCACERVGGTHS